MTQEELKSIFISRPFKTRNADEYNLENILDLFIDPTDGLVGPFDFSNSIIKGKMGSGKTMYLRANYAYYLYTLVPCLIEQDTIILPVYIKLSDFQNIKDAEKIYYEIIIKIIEEIVGVYKKLQSADELARLHTGASTLSGLWATEDTFSKITETLKKLTAEEYVDKITNSFNAKGSASSRFLSACANYEKNVISEIRMTTTPSFKYITTTCEQLLTKFNGKLLLLFDEVGSINETFFRSTKNTTSYFETLMNQLRTLPYVRTKIAVYPHSFSDSLAETRYGDIIELDCDVENNNFQYSAFMEKTVSLIDRYIEKSSSTSKAEDVFEISVNNQKIIEQLINASKGNMRRLLHLLDMSMNTAFIRSQGLKRVSIEDVLNSLKKQGEEMESKYSDKDKEFLSTLVLMCKKRSTYKFMFPYKSKMINKYTNLSEEYNIINIQQVGSGRQGNIYSFDYAYCIYKDIPTHYIRDSERIDKTRSTLHGEAISRVAQLSNELFLQSKIRGKIEGKISFVSKGEDSGFADGIDGKSYFISKSYVVNSDKDKAFRMGGKISFIASKLNNDALVAREIEILN